MSIYGDGTVVGFDRYAGQLPDMVQAVADRSALSKAATALEQVGLLNHDSTVGRRVPDISATTVLVHVGGKDVTLAVYEGTSDTDMPSGRRTQIFVADLFIHVVQAQLSREVRPLAVSSIAVAKRRPVEPGTDLGQIQIIPWLLQALSSL
ncbi:MAG: hypothetical protein M3256_22805, partial [Actinomycetota bacterium]|nr:hypothetical protein [Actinomycetota bacterium]